MITVFVFVMMLLVDFIDTSTQRRVSHIMKGGELRQYTLASFLGSTPGCLGAFMNVSLYVHGMISFGALVGGMIATSGDEAFVMLSQFPGTAMMLFGMLFIFGIIFGWISDKIIGRLGIIPCESCIDADCDHCQSEMDTQENRDGLFRSVNSFDNLKALSFSRFLLFVLIVFFLLLVTMGILGPSSWDWKRITFMGLSLCTLYIVTVSSEHYLQSHIWDHIIKKHLFRVFLWSFGALLFVHWGLVFWNMDAFVRDHMIWVLLTGALMGIVPESGPHLIFVMMYAQGLVPFSVLFTVSFVQDGHGMLPLLSYTIKDSILIKLFNLVFGLVIGSILFFLGV
ncbi:MAG: putative manganese transporter [Thermodesulfobacteriota bacterium]|nr:putative manganese transporter [Thermodesulfobacteriota bacterium]